MLLTCVCCSVKHEGLVIMVDQYCSNLQDSIVPADLFNLNSFNLTALSLDHYREHDFPVYRSVCIKYFVQIKSY